MKGITLRTYRAHYGRALTKKDLRAISDEEIQEIYHDSYWKRVRGSKLPRGLDHVVFDAAVNSGTSRSAKWLQKSVGAKSDGWIGPNTIKKVLKKDPKRTIENVLKLRLKFLRTRKNYQWFGEGWEARVERVNIEAREMIEGKA